MVRSVAKELEEAKSATFYLPANPGLLVYSSVLNGKKNFSHLLYINFNHSKDLNSWSGHNIPGCQTIIARKKKKAIANVSKLALEELKVEV